MDRRTVLEQLDAVRPDSDDLGRPEMAAARQALRDDPEISEEWESRRQLDAKIAGAIRDVPLPDGLRERLLHSIDSAAARQSDPKTTPPPSPRVMRRNVLALLATAAACLLLGGIYWSGILNPNHPLTVADVENAAARFLSGSTEKTPFDGQFEPQPPRNGRWRSLRFDQGVYGLLPSPEGHRAAAWRFTYNGAPGVLVAIPRQSIASPPDTTRDYAGGNTIAWSEGEFVYVCRVEGRIDELLRRIDEGRLA